MIFQTTVEQKTTNYHIGSLRVDGHNPGNSVVYQRMSSRDEGVQMPPFATEQPDMVAVDAVAAWINSLP